MRKLLIKILFCLLVIGISGDVYAQDDKKIYEQAETAFNAGNFEEAQKLYQKYLDFYPQGEKVSQVRFRLAESSFQLRDFAMAARLYEQVGDLYPELELAKQSLTRAGECFQKIGDYAKAKKVFDKIQNRYPDTPEADYAKYNLSELERYLPDTPLKEDKKLNQPGEKQPTTTEEELLQKAKEEFQAKNYQKALSGFKNFLEEFKTSSFVDYAQLKIAECFYYQNKFQEALKEYKKVVTNYPESKYVDYALYSSGWCHYRLGDSKEAISSFERLIKEYPDSKYTASSQNAISKIKVEYEEKKAKELLGKGKSFYEDKKYRQAKEVITNLVEHYPTSEVITEAKELLTKIDENLIVSQDKEARTIYDRGEAALKDKNYDEAIHQFKRVIFEFPESDYANLAQKAIVLVEEEKDYLAAKKKWEESVKLYEEQKTTEAKKGFEEIVTEYPKTKYKEEAEEKLVELETQENELAAYKTYKKALALMKEKDYAEAINLFQKILSDYPETNYTSLAKAGVSEAKEALKNDRLKRKFEIAQRYYQLGDYKSAQEWFEEIKENYPNTEYSKKSEQYLVDISKMGTSKDVEGEYNLALSFYEQGNLPGAISQFKKIIDKYPNTKFAKTASESLVTLQKKQNDELAKDLYDKAHHSQLAGEYTIAINQYDKLINQYPESYWTPYAFYEKAEILYAQAEFTQAREEWQKVADKFPTSDLVPYALYHVAECYEQTGEYKKAYLSYETLQKTYPDSIYGKGELAELIKDKIALLKAK